jgi:Thiolase, N-terminal domain
MLDPGESAAGASTHLSKFPPRNQIAMENSEVQHRTVMRGRQVWARRWAVSVKSERHFKAPSRIFHTGISVITKIALPESSLAQQLALHAFPARLVGGGLSMTSKHSIVIAEPVRTAIGTFGGTLKDIPAVELGATAINAALQRSGLQPNEIGTVVMGNTVQAGNKMNPARQAAIHGGLPVQVPAMTVNRVCAPARKRSCPRRTKS